MRIRKSLLLHWSLSLLCIKVLSNMILVGSNNKLISQNCVLHVTIFFFFFYADYYITGHANPIFCAVGLR